MYKVSAQLINQLLENLFRKEDIMGMNSKNKEIRSLSEQKEVKFLLKGKVNRNQSEEKKRSFSLNILTYMLYFWSHTA